MGALGVRLLRQCLMLAFLAGALSGCLFDGISVPYDYRPRHIGATQPIEDLAVFMQPSKNAGAAAYVRFIKTSKKAYVMEQYPLEARGLLDRNEMMAFLTHFIPLGENWYAMHWEIDGGQKYTLAKLADGRLTISDLTPLKQRIQELGELADISFDTEPKHGIIIKKLPSEKKLIELLKVVASLPQSPDFSMSRVPAVPPDVVRGSMKRLAERVSMLDARSMEDSRMQQHLLAYFAQLHEEGNGWGSYALARFASNGWGIEQNFALSRQLADIAIERGVAQANFTRGHLAYFGIGETADPEGGVAYFRLAAQAHEPRAYTLLGMAYRDGRGVPKDKIEAKAWLERAVQASQRDAYTALAFELLEQRSAGDDLKAIEILDKAIQQDIAYASYLRGWMHDAGRGGQVNEAAATEHYLQAAIAGSANSQWLVGERLIAGRGIRATPDEGKFWIRRAALAGVPEAVSAMRKYGLKPLTPFDLGKTGFDTAYGEEQEDRNVKPEYGYTHIPHAFTPTSIPMARVIRTGQLHRLMQQQPEVVLIDVNEKRFKVSIPGAKGVPGLGWPLSEPAHRKRADAILHKLSGGSKDRPLVFYCTGPSCWLSYNAARYAAHTGYRDVIWYRGGLDAWSESGLGFQKPAYLEW